MTTEQCTSKHTYTITGTSGESIASTTVGPKAAWVHWANAPSRALDLTATHDDGTVCLAETRNTRTLLPGGPYETRKNARIDGQPLRDMVDAIDPDGEAADDGVRARRQAAADYVTGQLGHLGVHLGAFDQRIAAWVSEWEPEVVATILGWAARARAAGRDSTMRD